MDANKVSGEDLILVFLEECCVFGPEETSNSIDIWKGYKEWSVYKSACAPMPRKYLDKALVQAGAHRAKAARTWIGVGMKRVPVGPRTEASFPR